MLSTRAHQDDEYDSQDEISRLTKQLRMEIAQHHKEKKASTNQITALKDRNNQLVNLNESAKKTIKNHEATIHNQHAEIEQLKLKIQELQKKIEVTINPTNSRMIVLAGDSEEPKPAEDKNSESYYSFFNPLSWRSTAKSSDKQESNLTPTSSR